MIAKKISRVALLGGYHSIALFMLSLFINYAYLYGDLSDTVKFLNFLFPENVGLLHNEGSISFLILVIYL